MPSPAPQWPDLDRLAQRQHGVVTHAQLIGLGFSEAMLRTARRAQQLTPVHPGVYRFLGVPPSHLGLLLAATLRAGPSSAASHRSAGDLWGMRPDEAHLDVSIWHEARANPKHVNVHRTRDVDPNHFTLRRGIRVTKPARTLVDLASVLPRAELTEVVDRALVQNLVSEAGLRVVIAELARPGRRGPATLRRLPDDHPLAGVRRHSVLEPVMAAIIRECPRADRFVYQHPVSVSGESYRLDFAAPATKVGIEVLGLREHGTREAVIADSRRRRLLRLDGWDLLEYTRVEMTRSPVRVAREIVGYVDERERQFPGWTRIR